MRRPTTQPVREWHQSVLNAREEFVAAWERDPGSSKAAAEAIAALRRAFEHDIANWEALDLPDTHAPATAERALSDIASSADGQRVFGVGFARDNQPHEGVNWFLESFRSSVDFEVLNDFAVMLHTLLRAEDAMAVLTTVLLADPEREDARENYEALTGRKAP